MRWLSSCFCIGCRLPFDGCLPFGNLSSEFCKFFPSTADIPPTCSLSICFSSTCSLHCTLGRSPFATATDFAFELGSASTRGGSAALGSGGALPRLRPEGLPTAFALPTLGSGFVVDSLVFALGFCGFVEVENRLGTNALG